MKIHFCDLCNESVPQSDLDIGRAFTRKGRVVCATCDELMSAREAQVAASKSAAPVQPGGFAVAAAPAAIAVPVHAEARPVGGGVGAGIAIAVGVLAVVLTLALGYWSNEQLREIRGGFDGKLDELEASQRRVRLDLDGSNQKVTAELASLTRAIADSGTEQRNWLDGKMRDGADQAKVAAAQVASLGTRIDELKLGVERGAKRDVDIDTLRERCGHIEEQLTQMGTQIEHAMQAATAKAGVAPAPPQNQPSWMGTVEQLKSPSQSERWQAVYALSETHDVAVVPYLIPLLADKDIFVRITTAQKLGDLGSPLAVSPLIASLGDQASPVREAAYLALRTITKRDFPFDPQTEDVAERNKRIRVWEEWWKKESEHAGGASSQSAAH
jgi:hypothetical protein